MKNFCFIVFIIISSFLFFSCEKKKDPETVTDIDKITDSDTTDETITDKTETPDEAPDETLDTVDLEDEVDTNETNDESSDVIANDETQVPDETPDETVDTVDLEDVVDTNETNDESSNVIADDETQNDKTVTPDDTQIPDETPDETVDTVDLEDVVDTDEIDDESSDVIADDDNEIVDADAAPVCECTTGDSCCTDGCYFDTPGTPCGDSPAECEQHDTCNDSGVCIDNGTVVDGTPCTDDGQCVSGECLDCFDDEGCNENAQCNLAVNTCICKEGYEGDGENCTALCPDGYSYNAGSCIDIDECNESQDYCQPGEVCVNQCGSFKCLPTCFGRAADDPAVCNRNGVCTGIDNCECDTNHIGEKCNEAVTCFGLSWDDPDVCNGHGECVEPDTCECIPQWYTGEDGEACGTVVVCYRRAATRDDVCYGYGTCVYDPNKAAAGDPSYTGSCICDELHFGSYCSGTLQCYEKYPGEGACGDDQNLGQCVAPDTCECSYGVEMDSSGECVTDWKQCAGVYYNDPDVCDSQGECTNEDINEFDWYCICDSGYYGSICTFSYTCNYLTNKQGACSSNGICIAKDVCECNIGWTGTFCETPKTCYGIEFNDPSVCSGHGSCIDTDICECDPGYGGKDCSMLLSCSASCSDNPCSDGVECIDNPISGTGYTCGDCPEGFEGDDGENCRDIDECTVDTGACDTNATCVNTYGGYTCTCNAGYEGDGKSCKDINECIRITDACDANATCTNTAGSYTCACNEGYEGDGFTCEEIPL